MTWEDAQFIFVIETSPQALLAGLANEAASAVAASPIENREFSFRTVILRPGSCNR